MAQRVNLAGTGLPMRKKTFSAKEEAVITEGWIAIGAVSSTLVPVGEADGTWVTKKAASGTWVKSTESSFS